MFSKKDLHCLHLHTKISKCCRLETRASWPEYEMQMPLAQFPDPMEAHDSSVVLCDNTSLLLCATDCSAGGHGPGVAAEEGAIRMGSVVS